MGWGGDDNVQVRSKTDLSIHKTKGWGGVGWGNVQVRSKTDLRTLKTVGWGGVGMKTYRSGDKRVGWGGPHTETAAGTTETESAGTTESESAGTTEAPPLRTCQRLVPTQGNHLTRHTKSLVPALPLWIYA